MHWALATFVCSCTPTGHLSHYDKHDVCGIHNLKMSFLLRLERWCICAMKGMDFDKKENTHWAFVRQDHLQPSLAACQLMIGSIPGSQH